jgi:hypothetical protein
MPFRWHTLFDAEKATLSVHFVLWTVLQAHDNCLTRWTDDLSPLCCPSNQGSHPLLLPLSAPVQNLPLFLTVICAAWIPVTAITPYFFTCATCPLVCHVAV